MDYKTELQKFANRSDNLKVIHDSFKISTGKDIEDEKLGEGIGESVKKSEQEAAKSALCRLGIEDESA